ncbi:hypothetical protein [Actinotignum urinale]|uniref:hypothetical protein n=1 Tax=Actinotignum urinale TaxID=190146 RepID=UPI00370D8C99
MSEGRRLTRQEMRERGLLRAIPRDEAAPIDELRETRDIPITRAHRRALETDGEKDNAQNNQEVQSAREAGTGQTKGSFHRAVEPAKDPVDHSTQSVEPEVAISKPEEQGAGVSSPQVEQTVTPEPEPRRSRRFWGRRHAEPSETAPAESAPAVVETASVSEPLPAPAPVESAPVAQPEPVNSRVSVFDRFDASTTVIDDNSSYSVQRSAPSTSTASSAQSSVSAVSAQSAPSAQSTQEFAPSAQSAQSATNVASVPQQILDTETAPPAPGDTDHDNDANDEDVSTSLRERLLARTQHDDLRSTANSVAQSEDSEHSADEEDAIKSSVTIDHVEHIDEPLDEPGSRKWGWPLFMVLLIVCSIGAGLLLGVGIIRLRGADAGIDTTQVWASVHTTIQQIKEIA